MTAKSLFEAHPNKEVINTDIQHVYLLHHDMTCYGFCLVRPFAINGEEIGVVELFEVFVKGQGHGSCMFEKVLERYPIALPWQPKNIGYWLRMFSKYNIHLANIFKHLGVSDELWFCENFLCWTEEQTSMFMTTTP